MKRITIQMIRLNKIVVIFLLLLVVNSMYAQKIDRLFVNMPDEIIPTLTKNMRLELIEYFKVNKVDTIKDLFQNDAYMLRYDSVNQSVDLKITPNATLSVKLFATKAKLDTISYVVGVIQTVCGPVCSSQINFYDKNWNKIKLNFVQPSASDWLTDKSAEKEGIKIANVFKTSFVEFDFGSGMNELILLNHSDELLTVEDKLFVKPYLKSDNKIYHIKATLNEINITQ